MGTLILQRDLVLEIQTLNLKHQGTDYCTVDILTHSKMTQLSASGSFLIQTP